MKSAEISKIAILSPLRVPFRHIGGFDAQSVVAGADYAKTKVRGDPHCPNGFTCNFHRRGHRDHRDKAFLIRNPEKQEKQSRSFLDSWLPDFNLRNRHVRLGALRTGKRLQERNL
jgi:hypothetical protein